MDCPNCKQLNPVDALCCEHCGMGLLRREEGREKLGRRRKHSKKSEEAMPVGLSYGDELPQPSPLRIYASRANRFALFAIVLQALFIALVFFSEKVLEIVFRAPGMGKELGGIWSFILIIYGILVTAWATAKTGESLGMGFWRCFIPAMFPPLLPGVAARIGGRSVLWTYIYLALDALALFTAMRLFTFAPFWMFIAILLVIPFLVYHLSGCAMGAIAQALGLNATIITLWFCILPLAVIGYNLYTLGILEMLVNALANQGQLIDPYEFQRLLDPTLVTDNYMMIVVLMAYAGVSWLVWFKSVYESLRYPLF